MTKTLTILLERCDAGHAGAAGSLKKASTGTNCIPTHYWCCSKIKVNNTVFLFMKAEKHVAEKPEKEDSAGSEESSEEE